MEAAAGKCYVRSTLGLHISDKGATSAAGAWRVEVERLVVGGIARGNHSGAQLSQHSESVCGCGSGCMLCVGKKWCREGETRFATEISETANSYMSRRTAFNNKIMAKHTDRSSRVERVKYCSSTASLTCLQLRLGQVQAPP